MCCTRCDNIFCYQCGLDITSDPNLHFSTVCNWYSDEGLLERILVNVDNSIDYNREDHDLSGAYFSEEIKENPI